MCSDAHSITFMFVFAVKISYQIAAECTIYRRSFQNVHSSSKISFKSASNAPITVLILTFSWEGWPTSHTLKTCTVFSHCRFKYRFKRRPCFPKNSVQLQIVNNTVRMHALEKCSQHVLWSYKSFQKPSEHMLKIHCFNFLSSSKAF